MTDWTDITELENSVFITVEHLQLLINNIKNIYERVMVLESLKGGITPVGAILIWSGSYATIPDGFQLADGTNGTPDLRGKFIVGLSETEGDDDLNSTGGALQHTHTMGTISNATKHYHQVYLNNSTSFVNADSGVNAVAFSHHGHGWSAKTSSADEHTHSGTYVEADHLPPYTKYYYIARIPA